MTTLGDRVKLARERIGMGQSELADAIGMRPQSVWRIEAGESAGSRATVKKIAKSLGVDEAWLRYGIGSLPDPETRKVLREYFADQLGKDTPEPVRVLLESLDFGTIGVHRPTVREVHRVRELVEHNLRSRQNAPNGGHQ